jgi:hypothetical protein
MLHLFASSVLTLSTAALAAPDFQVDAIVASCHNGYQPRLTVTVSNQGDTVGVTFLDVFMLYERWPEPGDVGEDWVGTGLLWPGQSKTFTIDLTHALAIDNYHLVVLDNDQGWVEVDEDNNYELVWGAFRDCFLG